MMVKARHWAGMLAAIGAPAGAAPLLHSMFQDHAVLQRDAPIPVYGQAVPGSEVTVTLGASSAHAAADASGRWQLSLPAMPAGGPYRLEARTGAGEVQDVEDVLIGDVYLCSGQSNMQFEVRGAENAQFDMMTARDGTIRSLTIATKDSIDPLATFATPVKWVPTAPDTVGAFSATCYFFARERKKSVNVPVGMVIAAWGGSRVRAWVSEPGLRAAGLERESLDLVDLRRTQPEAADHGWGNVWERWWHSLAIKGGEPWQPGFDAKGWAVAPDKLGPWAFWTGSSPDGFTGQMWLRSEVTLTAAQAAQGAILDLGTTNEEDQTWVNGRSVGGTSWARQSRHTIPAGLLHEGANTIVTNIFCSWRNCGMTGPAESRAIRLADGTSVPLKGPWRYAPMAASAIAPQLPWGPAHGASIIYNGMIAPIGPYGFRAALWYQGESDIHYAPDYERNLRTLMADWRRRFRPDLPFLIVQLPNFGPHPTQPTESDMADIREAQRRAAAADRLADYTVTIDIGDPGNIHPTKKQEVGRRLALTAERLLDHKPTKTGPRGDRARLVGHGVTIHFAEVSGKLVSYSGSPTAFELCGASAGSCRYVLARIASPDSVILDAGAVRPTRVRYCWGDSPICTLSDASELPAGPFELPVR